MSDDCERSAGVCPERLARGEPLVEIDELVVEYGSARRDASRAVDGVSLAIRAGRDRRPRRRVGLRQERRLGERAPAASSGRPAEIVAGRIVFDGVDIVTMSPEDLRQFRWRHVSMVFQSAMNSLNPVTRVGDQFLDMFRAHEKVPQAARRSDVRATCSSSSASTATACAHIRTSSPAACGSAS